MDTVSGMRNWNVLLHITPPPPGGSPTLKIVDGFYHFTGSNPNFRMHLGTSVPAVPGFISAYQFCAPLSLSQIKMVKLLSFL